MNTKNKIIAILMAGIVAMAVGAPMAIGDVADTSATVGGVNPTIACTDKTANLGQKTHGGPADETFHITGTVDDGNGYGDISGVTCNAAAVFGTNHVSSSCTISETTGDPPTDGTFDCTITLKRCTPATAYTVNVVVTDNADGSANCNSIVTIESTTGLELDFDEIPYGGITIGTRTALTGDAVWDPLNTGPRTIHSTGNTQINISITAANMTRTGGTVGESLDTIYATELDATVDTVGSTSLATTPVNFAAELTCDGDAKMDFGITADHPARVGAYTGTVTISVA